MDYWKYSLGDTGNHPGKFEEFVNAELEFHILDLDNHGQKSEKLQK